MHFYLLGFMGAGKTHWGKIWANIHHFDFTDLDSEIEKREQDTIAGIFEKNGEDYFRKKEAEVLRTLSLPENAIISCGGGSPCFHENIHWMNKHGVTVFLKATPSYILGNIKHEVNKRPILKNTNEAELLFFIEKKLKEREPFYRQAKITVEAASLTPQSFKEISRY